MFFIVTTAFQIYEKSIHSIPDEALEQAEKEMKYNMRSLDSTAPSLNYLFRLVRMISSVFKVWRSSTDHLEINAADAQRSATDEIAHFYSVF
jgi:lysyl-tRNA synthetase class II